MIAQGRLVDFLTSLSFFGKTSVFAVQAVANVVTRKSFIPSQLCLAHPPDASLGSAAYNHDYIYMIFSGEARLLAAPPAARGGAGAGAGGGAVEKLSLPSSVTLGPMADTPPPANSKVEAYVGAYGPIATVATLGPGECISANLMPHANSRWCLKPMSHLEILVVPRKEFHDNLRPAVSSIPHMSRSFEKSTRITCEERRVVSR